MYTLIKHNLTGRIFHCRIVLPTVLWKVAKSDKVGQIDKTPAHIVQRPTGKTTGAPDSQSATVSLSTLNPTLSNDILKYMAVLR